MLITLLHPLRVQQANLHKTLTIKTKLKLGSYTKPKYVDTGTYRYYLRTGTYLHLNIDKLRVKISNIFFLLDTSWYVGMHTTYPLVKMRRNEKFKDVFLTVENRTLLKISRVP